jgi:hypothetical protein
VKFFYIWIWHPSKIIIYRFLKGVGHNRRWLDVVFDIYKERQKLLLNEHKKKDKSILVYLDARYDSLNNAVHGTIVMINAETGEVIHIVIKTREEAGSAWDIEDLAIEEILQDSEAKGIKIFEVVHDDKHSVDMLLTNHKIVS